MQILINGNMGVVRYYGHGLPLGLLLNPGGGTPVAQAVDSGKWWALDNGAFGKTEPAMFWRWVSLVATTPGALDRLLFVVPPDVPFSAAGSLAMLDGWWRSFAYEEIPIAFVGQDGLTRAMWRGWVGLCSCFFIGGTTAWKLGPVARMYAALAKRRGMHVHMGRVNSVKRLAYAMSIGCDSVDGTGLTKYSAAHLPRVKRALFPGYLDMPPLIDPQLLRFGSSLKIERAKMKVAELKRRLVPGTKLTRINCLMGPGRKLRTVAKVNSVDFMVCDPGTEGPLSHCAWPKASELVETPLGFQISIDGEIAVEYEWGHNTEPFDMGEFPALNAAMEDRGGALWQSVYMGHVLLSADTPDRLRACDVYRVMQSAWNNLDGGKFDGFRIWLAPLVNPEAREEVENWMPGRRG